MWDEPKSDNTFTLRKQSKANEVPKEDYENMMDSLEKEFEDKEPETSFNDKRFSVVNHDTNNNYQFSMYGSEVSPIKTDVFSPQLSKENKGRNLPAMNHKDSTFALLEELKIIDEAESGTNKVKHFN